MSSESLENSGVGVVGVLSRYLLEWREKDQRILMLFVLEQPRYTAEGLQQ